ncbi:beta-lactamase family protein [Kitasatospora sp. NBC_01250]|uniref:serine hydrolase domain-containing protein n=1 Tax=unclassified Kitasatospora TaxID=2633591 RepID=UPI002E102C25|nr:MULTISPECIES: serine hydrolase domain-containing protein [unclassified Kitasatospora]WSJ70431.1 beta-lactamase family protein [Kitasatospora sp. NBC_01302]
MRALPTRKAIAAAALALAGLLQVAAVPAQAAAPARMVQQDQPGTEAGRLDSAIQQALQQTGVPGAIVGLWQPGQPDYVRTFGYADSATKTPMSTDLHMRLGSETKTFTATAVLQLVDQGKVGLDDPISKYVSGVPNGDNITLRQLLEMRSGLFPYTSDSTFINKFLANPTAPWTPEQLVALGFAHPNLFAPGSQFLYDNSNYILLGLVVEKVSGQDLAGYLHDHVTGPAGLSNTYLASGTALADPHAQGYTVQTPTGQEAISTNWDPSWAWAAGAEVSTLNDLHKWAVDVATGTLLGNAVQAQRTNFIPVNSANPQAGYGLGLVDISGWIGHNGSLPGYESVAVYLPSQQATLVVLINSDITYQGYEPSTVIAKAITGIATPGNIYDIPPTG